MAVDTFMGEVEEVMRGAEKIERRQLKVDTTEIELDARTAGAALA